MAIRFSSDLEKQFKEVEKNIRMWPTWKLKTRELGLHGEEKPTTWDNMSKRDQDYNIAWNELTAIVRKMSLPKLLRLVKAAYLIQSS
jgi:hypothetical protein